VASFVGEPLPPVKARGRIHRDYMDGSERSAEERAKPLESIHIFQ